MFPYSGSSYPFSFLILLRWSLGRKSGPSWRAAVNVTWRSSWQPSRPIVATLCSAVSSILHPGGATGLHSQSACAIHHPAGTQAYLSEMQRGTRQLRSLAAPARAAKRPRHHRPSGRHSLGVLHLSARRGASMPSKMAIDHRRWRPPPRRPGSHWNLTSQPGLFRCLLSRGQVYAGMGRLICWMAATFG